ncbi:hypothetical protein [Deinococcus hohokamensis]|uniref:Acetoacetate decarboxylase n=1 Tax=Deinococcus hohokamensis TaxID=309883 RepID=A0ABV9IBC0_9DEIO
MTPPPWRLSGHGLLALYAPARSRPPGAVMLVRYANSPVGPYDELLWLEWTGGLRRAHPVVRHIVVSSEQSVQWGRRNWALPKRLARFEWPAPTQVRVSTPAGTPLAALHFQPSPWSLHTRLNLLPRRLRTLAQPALDGSGRIDTLVQGEGGVGPARLHHADLTGLVPEVQGRHPWLTLAVPEFRLLFPPGVTAARGPDRPSGQAIKKPPLGR